MEVQNQHKNKYWFMRKNAQKSTNPIKLTKITNITKPRKAAWFLRQLLEPFPRFPVVQCLLPSWDTGSVVSFSPARVESLLKMCLVTDHETRLFSCPAYCYVAIHCGVVAAQFWRTSTELLTHGSWDVKWLALASPRPVCPPLLWFWWPVPEDPSQCPLTSGFGEALSERSECSRNEPHPHLLRWL